MNKTNQYRKNRKEWYDKQHIDGLLDMSKLILFREPQYEDWWGDWYYATNDTLELHTKPVGYDKEFMVYWIDFDRMRSSAEVLDWIAQVSHKTWCSSEMLANLIWALDDILELQHKYCGCGAELKSPA